MIHVFVPFTEVISVHYLINANFRPFYLSTVETNTRSSYFDASTTNGSIPYYNYDCKVADCSAPFHESFNVLYPCCFVQTINRNTSGCFVSDVRFEMSYLPVSDLCSVLYFNKRYMNLN